MPRLETETTAPQMGRPSIRDAIFAAGWLMMAVAAPVAYSTEIAATFFSVKLIPLYAGIGLMTVAFALPAGRPSEWARKASRPLTISADGLLILLFLALGLASVVAASSPAVALTGVWNQGTGWVFWLAAMLTWTSARSVRLDTDLARLLMVVAVGTGVLVAIVAMAQAGGWEYLRFKIGLRSDGRAGSTFGNPLYLGAYLSVLAVTAAHLGAGARSLWARLMGVVAGLVLVVGISVTLSRGAWLALAFGMVCWLLFALRPRELRRRVLSIFLTTAAAALVSALVIAPAISHDLGGRTERSTVTLATESSEESSSVESPLPAVSTVRTRLVMWGTAMDAIRDRPILGWGPNNFRFAALQHMRPDKLRWEPQTRDADAHSLPLEIASTWGLPALAVLALLGAVVARTLFRRRDDPAAPLAAGALTAFLAASLTMPQHIVVTPIALAIAAMALGSSATARGADAPFARDTRGRTAAAARAGGLVLACALTAVLVFTSVRWYAAEAHYLRGELRGDSAELRAATDAFPFVDTYWNSLGSLEVRQRDADSVNQGIRDLRKALELSPRAVEARLTVAGTYLERGDWLGARLEAETAASHAPLEPMAHAYLAYALHRRGEVEQARREAEAALRIEVPEPRLYYTVGLYYRDSGDTADARVLFEKAVALDPSYALARAALSSLR